MILTLDVETSTHNKGNPFDTRNILVSIHSKVTQSNDSVDAPTVCKFFDDPDFVSDTRSKIRDCSLFVGVNCKFDLHWLRTKGLQLASGARVWDCMVAEFLLSGQLNSFASLDKLAEIYGLGKKQSLVAEYWEKGISTEHIPRDIVREYGNHDVDLTRAVYECQRRDPRLTPELHKLILLEGADLLVLEEMEWNGFLYNVEGSKAKSTILQNEIDWIEAAIYAHSPEPFNIDGDCLSYFLYGGTYTEELYTPVEQVYKSGPRKGETYLRNRHSGTKTVVFPGLFKPPLKARLDRGPDDNPLFSTAEKVLLQLPAKTKKQQNVISLLLHRAELHKLITTYLDALPKLIEDMSWADNKIHGQFNQVVARTGRLSSSRPNMQNASGDVDEFFISRYAD